MGGAERDEEGKQSQGLSYAFGRSRRVRLRRDSDVLFQRGGKRFEYPYRGVVYACKCEAGIGGGCRLLAVVPKRVFKHAVDRNAQRRRIREFFRVETAALHALCRERGVRLDVAIIAVAGEEVPLGRARRSMRKIFVYAEQMARRV